MTIDSDSAQFSRTLKSAIVWPVSVIFLTSLMLLGLIFWLFQTVKWSDHSYEVIAHARTCQKLATETQNCVRGYLLTGDPTFLDTYTKDLPIADAEFEQLRKLVSDNPQQTIRAENLIQAKNTWFQYSKTMISHRQQSPVVNADWVRMGRTFMDNLDSQFDAFGDVEEGLRDKRLKNVRRVKRALGYAGGGLVILLSLTVGQSVRRNFMDLAAAYRATLRTLEQRHDALVRSEADLEEQKEWFRVTLASIGDGVIVTDQEGRVVFMNHESERLTGWNGVEALLKPLATVFDIVNEETRRPAENPVSRVFREKKVVGLANHTLLLSRSGEQWPVEDSAAPICDAKGKVLGVVMVFHDASEMRRAQHTLKAYSADLEKKVTERTTTLQQAVLELETFSYTVSHDLRAPLRAMQGFAQAVEEDYADKLDERGKNYLQRIQNAALRLDRLIQDLLSYTRLARQDAPLVALDLDKMVREIIEHYPNLHPPAAEVIVEGTLPKVLGQEAALTQVVSNLLGNAAKFIRPGAVARVRVRGEDLGSRLRLWIEDNGIGISPKEQDRIFEMFVQLNESQLYGGTGVGLAIVKKAVQTMHGSIGVESEEGSGSKFWVELDKA